MNKNITLDKYLTYNYLLSLNIKNYTSDIEDICLISDKEYSLEQALDAMLLEWSELSFELKEHKTTFILKGIDEIMEKLDDHIVKTQSMSGSPYMIYCFINVRM